MRVVGKSGLPVSLSVPSTTQLFEPSAFNRRAAEKQLADGWDAA
jgi:hypothetical protein